MKRILLILLTCTFIYSCEHLEPLADTVIEAMAEPTEAEVDAGLREALTVGITNAVLKTSKKDGFYGNNLIKIPLPPEVKNIESTVRKFGGNQLMDDFEISLNRAAEEASAKAVDVFAHSISQMTINDVVAIWKGPEDAATQYLKRTSSTKLEAEFKPIAKNAIEKVHVTQYWDDIANIYNKIPLVTPVNPDLDNYVTHEAIEGLFKMVAIEERKIREDPAARVTDLLVKVFGYEK
jgi:hypothetical protein